MIGLIIELVVTIGCFYGGLIWLGLMTSWKVAFALFLILAGFGLHLDYIFLQRRNLRREIKLLILEDLSQMVVVHPDMEADLEAMDEKNLH
ncbi:MAG: hypothetical protein PVI03_05895 [Candidatus Thorarchaeota archaeon]|jgi:membrane protein implicated in regulation of membrane protease activity